jgi:hypothetical protein
VREKMERENKKKKRAEARGIEPLQPMRETGDQRKEPQYQSLIPLGHDPTF